MRIVKVVFRTHRALVLGKREGTVRVYKHVYVLRTRVNDGLKNVFDNSACNDYTEMHCESRKLVSPLELI